MLIEVPPKIWQPRVISRYRMPIYTDIDNGVFEFESYDKYMFRPTYNWDAGERTDIIMFNESSNTVELTKDLRFGKHITPENKIEITDLIKKFWDCFCVKGCHRPIIGYKFAIDTRTHTLVCCRKPSYGFHEAKIIQNQIASLLGNKWIHKCGVPWGSLIVLVAKPHQEYVIDINDFIWRMCVSYRALNRITKPFQLPIPRCDDYVYMLGNGSVLIFIITLDDRQGYHQIAVKQSDQEKLIFFSPDDFKYCYTVMPFGPTNAHPFYTAMMRNFKEEWDKLFVTRVVGLGHANEKKTVISSGEVHM